MISGLDKRVTDNLVEYLTFELQRARAERAELDQDWIRYQITYRARPCEKEKLFPWKGAANAVIALAATDIDITVAGLLGTIFSAPNLWSCEGLRPDWMEFAAKLEEYLEWAQESELGMYAVCVDWITEICKLGTGILKQRYRREQKRMFEWRETGPGQVMQQMVRRLAVDRPDVSHVPLPNLYVPATANSIKDAAWATERLELSWTQLENRVNAGIYSQDFLTKIGSYWRQQRYPDPRVPPYPNQPKTVYREYQSAQEALDHFLPGINDKFEIFESWLDYDLDRTGEPVATVCTFHEPTKTIARIDYNPFFHQEKPYSEARFLKVENRFYGIGLCEMLEIPQEIVSTMNNQRLDNGTIRNTVGFKGRRGVGIKQDEPWWPGRVWLMDNPETDLVPFTIGSSAESTIAEEQNLVNFSRQRTGVSDYDRGGAGNPAISYSTATTTIEMLQRGKLRPDQTLREIRKALDETGQRVVELLQQYDQGGKPYLVMGDKAGEVVQRVLQFPLDTIRLGVSIKVTATDSRLNRETKIRTDQIIVQQVVQFYQQLFQGMSLVANPQLPMPLRVLAAQMVNGGTILARRILEAYGEKDVDNIIPDLEQLHNVTQQLESIGAQAGAGGSPVPQGPPQSSGMAAVPPGAAGVPGLRLLPGQGAA